MQPTMHHEQKPPCPLSCRRSTCKNRAPAEPLCLTSVLFLFWAVSVVTAAMMRPWQPCTGFFWCAVLLPTLARATEFISVWPEKLVVEFGCSIGLNCSSNCNGIGLETNLDHVPAGNGTTWKAFHLTGVNQWAPTLLCYAGCTNNITLPHAEITVYRAPERVALDPVPKMEVGKEYNLTCRISNVAPIRNLTVTLLKAGKTVLVKTFESHTEAKAGEVVVIHNMTAVQADHGKEVTCVAALDLRPDGPFLESTSSYVTVMAVGLPKPILGIDQPKILVNRSVLITCRCNETGCSGTEMQISDSKHVLENGHPPFLQHALTTRKEDDGREFICRVARMVDGHPVVKETSVHLTVFYGPQMNDSSCPTRLTWQEGSEETFTCSAWGNPPPMVECKKGDRTYNTGVQQHVNKEYEGLYHCNASNAYGSAVRNVTIHVERLLKQVRVELQKSSPDQSWAYTLRCHVIGMIPSRNITVTLLKGAERLHVQTIGNRSTPQRENFTVTHPITLRPQDHGQEATCHVNSAFSPYEQPFHSTVKLRTAETTKAVIVAAASIAVLAAELGAILTYCLVCGYGSSRKTR